MDKQQNDELLMKQAETRVKQRVGLIIHAICWLVISLVIIIVVPGEVMGVRPGFLVLLFWGICVLIHAIATYAAFHTGDAKKKYSDSVQREYEKLKQENK